MNGHKTVGREKSMITNEFTICQTRVELNIMLEAQDIKDYMKITVLCLVKYWFENVKFKTSIRVIINVS